jgi:hypothetical protein
MQMRSGVMLIAGSRPSTEPDSQQRHQAAHAVSGPDLLPLLPAARDVGDRHLVDPSSGPKQAARISASIVKPFSRSERSHQLGRHQPKHV